METVINNSQDGHWNGASRPFKASYGKMMMWYFILSDALTFTGFLLAYGLTKFKFIDSWPIADEVFNHFPFLHGVHAPMYYVALMTFILIFSSVTMVLAVDAGHKLQKNKVVLYLFLTIIGGAIFLGSQAWEWKNFIQGSTGAIELGGLKNAKIGDQQMAFDYGEIMHVGKMEDGIFHKVSLGEVVTGDHHNADTTFTLDQVKKALQTNNEYVLRVANNNNNIVPASEGKLLLEHAEGVLYGSNLHRNEYGKSAFADFFFFITGFHGFHVFSGVVLNILIFLNVLLGTYERRKSYEMVEKVGLYWHFVDLVWVFVFTFFYLV